VLTTLKTATLAPNPECQDEDDDAGEGAIAAQSAERVAQVLTKEFEPREGAGFAMVLAGLRHAAEADEGLAARFFRREAAAKVVLDGGLQVRGHFRIEIGIEGSAFETRRGSGSRRVAANRSLSVSFGCDRHDAAHYIGQAPPIGGVLRKLFSGRGG
jgi:hypothetical protein